MLERKTVSQCPTSDYCKGWNDAVDVMPKWISVEERLPKGANGSDFCELVIVYTQDYYVTTGWNNGGNWYLIDWYNDYASKHSPEYVTHWMPLPPAPENTITPKEAD